MQREAYRVLAPGGRFAVSDIAVQSDLPPVLCRDMESWTGCVAGALDEAIYRLLLCEAGFIKRHYWTGALAGRAEAGPGHRKGDQNVAAEIS